MTFEDIVNNHIEMKEYLDVKDFNKSICYNNIYIHKRMNRNALFLNDDKSSKNSIIGGNHLHTYLITIKDSIIYNTQNHTKNIIHSNIENSVILNSSVFNTYVYNCVLKNITVEGPIILKGIKISNNLKIDFKLLQNMGLIRPKGSWYTVLKDPGFEITNYKELKAAVFITNLKMI